MSSEPTTAFYVASRASVPERPAMWRALRESGVRITSTWIYEAGPGETPDMGVLWSRIVREVLAADALLLYAEPADLPLKGALVEVGIALAGGRPVGVIAPMCPMGSIGSWMRHPQVSSHFTVEEAIEYLDVRGRHNLPLVVPRG